MKTYTSCNCSMCRTADSKTKKEHKKKAHRVLRRKEKEAILKDKEIPNAISTGYKK